MPQLIGLCGVAAILYMMATAQGNRVFLGALLIGAALTWTALRGDGKDKRMSDKPCTQCNGTGEVPGMKEGSTVTCPVCRGKGTEPS